VSHLWPWILVALLGAYHGLNPAMGWLFAVALGMQERSRGAVLRALPPIALGHVLSVGLVVVLVLALGVVATPAEVKVGAGLALVAFGIFRLLKPRAHFRWTTMRVNRAQLSWWSFLMSTAHGAGLMVAPVLLGAGAADAEAGAMGGMHHDMGGAPLEGAAGGAAVLLHAGAMLAVMAVVAVVVYERLGVAVLRRAWVNSDGIWAVAFVLAGVLVLALS
jgi:hypothetical protein